jgi:hypothetical protein
MPYLLLCICDLRFLSSEYAERGLLSCDTTWSYTRQHGATTQKTTVHTHTHTHIFGTGRILVV